MAVLKMFNTRGRVMLVEELDIPQRSKEGWARVPADFHGSYNPIYDKGDDAISNANQILASAKVPKIIPSRLGDTLQVEAI